MITRKGGSRPRYYTDSRNCQIVDSATGVRHDYGAMAREGFFQADGHRVNYSHQDALLVALWLSGYDLPLGYDRKAVSDFGNLL